MQLSPDRLPSAITLELAKDIIDGRAWQKGVAEQAGPEAAGAQQIQNSVRRRPHVGFKVFPSGLQGAATTSHAGQEATAVLQSWESTAAVLECWHGTAAALHLR